MLLIRCFHTYKVTLHVAHVYCSFAPLVKAPSRSPVSFTIDPGLTEDGAEVVSGLFCRYRYTGKNILLPKLPHTTTDNSCKVNNALSLPTEGLRTLGMTQTISTRCHNSPVCTITTHMMWKYSQTT